MTIKRSSLTLPYFVFLVFLVVIPLALIMVYAFTNSDGSFTLNNFVKLAKQAEDVNTFIYSIEIAVFTTALCLILGYPAAWILSNSKLNRSKITIMLFILPMWINLLVRTLATVALFDFLKLPLGQGALMFGMVYDFLPFMIFPIYNSLMKMDPSFSEAAQDLGASPFQVFTKVTVPLSMPGVSSGIMMVFMPTVSTFAIAELLTMNKIKLFGTVIQENVNNGLLNYASVLALVMLIIIGITTLYTDESETESNTSGGMI